MLNQLFYIFLMVRMVNSLILMPSAWPGSQGFCSKTHLKPNVCEAVTDPMADDPPPKRRKPVNVGAMAAVVSFPGASPRPLG